MILIAALTRERVIGVDDRLPWHVPDEYAHFLRAVTGNAVIFGRRSFEIFSADLADTPIFVVSRDRSSLPGAEVHGSLEDALAAARATGRRVFCAGGAQIYALAMPHADEMWLSWMDVPVPRGDAYFPEFDVSEWSITRTEHHPGWEYVEYRRV